MHLFVFTSELLQAIRWRSKYNRCTKKSENKVEGSSPSQIFFFYFFLFFALAKMREINFRDLHVCRKKNMF